MRVICVAAMFLVLLGISRADSISILSSGNAALNSGLDTLPDLGNGLSGAPEWTTAENIGLTGNLFALITTLGGNSADIALLFQNGAVFGNLNANVITQSMVAAAPVSPLTPKTASSSPAAATRRT